ncbi:DUF6372 family protein [Nocardia thailandica]
MIGDAAPAPILTVAVPAALTWTQHAPGGCRCLCQIYHRGVGGRSCVSAAEPGLLITLEVPADAPPVPGADAPLPVCAACYRLLAVPDTPVAVLRARLDAALAPGLGANRFEAAAVGLLADTGVLGHLGVRAHIGPETVLDDDTGDPVEVVRLDWRGLLMSTADLHMDIGSERVLELALSLTLGDPIDLADTLLEIRAEHHAAVVAAIATALGHPGTPTTPGDLP